MWHISKFKHLFTPYDHILLIFCANNSNFVYSLSVYLVHISYAYDYVTNTCSPLLSFQCGCMPTHKTSLLLGFSLKRRAQVAKLSYLSTMYCFAALAYLL
jgi:hypothetical protein